MTETEQDSGIKELKEAFYDNLDNWPSESLKKTLFRLRPEEGAEVYLNLSEGNYDVTDQSIEIENRFRPNVTIRTRELKTELDRWDIGGGAFFRVIGDAETPSKAKKLSIQYLILWTRQLFPFQFLYLGLPLFVAALFLWQFTDFFSVYNIGDYSLEKYLTLLIIGTVFIALGFWTYVDGFIKRNIVGIKNWKTVPDSMIGFVLPGLLMWTTGLEIAIMELANVNQFIALIPISAWIALLLGTIIIFIGADFYIRGEKSYVERFSHPMDYAPLIIYLAKNDEGDWEIDGTQFDFFHYKTMFIPKEKMTFKDDETKKEKAEFLIDRSWHAFREYINTGYLIRLFSNLITHFVLWTTIIGATTVYILMRLDVAIYNLADLDLLYQLLILIGVFILLPMLAILLIYSRGRTREYELEMWKGLEEKEPEEILTNHYLSFDKLRILWNLRNREHKGEQQITSLWSKSSWIEGDSSRLVARVKLQYPFDRYKGWHTLRDTQEELLSLVSLQTKQEELRELEDEIVEVKDQLEKQVVQGIQVIEEELTDFYEEQMDEIEEEKEEILDKLEALDEQVDEIAEEVDDIAEAEKIEAIDKKVEDIKEEIAEVEAIEEEKEQIEESAEQAIEETEEKLEEIDTTETKEDTVLEDLPMPEADEVTAEETENEETSEPLDIPDVPTIEEIKDEDEVEFKIPDIPIDVEKEED